MSLDAYKLHQYEQYGKEYGVSSRVLQRGKWIQAKSSRSTEKLYVKVVPSPGGFTVVKRVIIRDERYVSSTGEHRGGWKISSGNESQSWDTGLEFPTYEKALSFAKRIMREDVIR